MNTAEMWTKAQTDGKIYECVDGDVAYSKKYGLTDKCDFSDPWDLGAWVGAHGIDKLMSCEWEEMKIMTVEQAQRALGVKIV